MTGVCKREFIGRSPVDEQLTLTRCLSCGLPPLNEALGWKSGCGRAYNLKRIKGKVSFLTFVSLLQELISWHDACRTGGGGRS